jgi:type I restriction enzyme S subunit
MSTAKTASQTLQRFNGEWETKRLGNVAHIKTGSKNNEDKDENGQYPLFVRSAIVERINSYCYEGEAILVPGEGGIGSIFHYINGRFDCHQRVYMINKFSDDVCGKLVYYSMVLQFGSHAMQNTVKATVDSLRLPTFKNFSFSLSQDIGEQRAIAEALSDMDGLLNALEALIAKKRAIKQAVMQQLLTGKTRLPGFSGAWETKRFGELFKRLNGNSHKIQTSEYSVNGLHPVIDQGQDTIVAYSDRTEKLFKCPVGGVIVFGDHTRIVKFVDVDFLIGADGTQLLAMKGNDVTKFLYYQLSTKDIPNTGYNRHFKFLKDLTFKIPRSEEQRAIASVLSDMDTEITALEQRRDKTRAIKQGMMQQLLMGQVRLMKTNTVSNRSKKLEPK